MAISATNAALNVLKRQYDLDSSGLSQLKSQESDTSRELNISMESNSSQDVDSTSTPQGRKKEQYTKLKQAVVEQAQQRNQPIMVSLIIIPNLNFFFKGEQTVRLPAADSESSASSIVKKGRHAKEKIAWVKDHKKQIEEMLKHIYIQSKNHCLYQLGKTAIINLQYTSNLMNADAIFKHGHAKDGYGNLHF